MKSREELLSSPYYWFEHLQNELWRQVNEYKIFNKLTKKELAQVLGISKKEVKIILAGEFNGSLKELTILCLTIGIVPKISYNSLHNIIKTNRAYKEAKDKLK